MKEFFEKIKERLENEVQYQQQKAHLLSKTYKVSGKQARLKMAECYEHAIEIVNQVAEEYNDGWIPCSERLPERCKWYLVTYKFHDLPKATCHELYYGDEYGYEQRWYLDDEYTELDAPFDVIAWRELPAPYKPKGENNG